MRFSDRIVVGLSSDCRRIVFLLAEAIHGVSADEYHEESLVFLIQISMQLVVLGFSLCLVSPDM